MKRVLTLILSAAIVICSLGVGVFAAAGTAFSVKAPDVMPKSGETFTVTVDISGNTAFYAAQFTLSYNTAELVCTNAAEGALLEDKLAVYNPDGDGGAVVAAASERGVKGDGTLAVYTFEALKDVTDYGLAITVNELADENGSAIPYTVEDFSPASQPDDNGKTDNGKTDNGETDNGKTDNGKTDNGKTDNGETDNGKTDNGKTDNGETDNGKTDNGNNAPAVVSFSDTKGHWGEQYIEKAVQAGLFKGYEDGSFGPDIPVTRAQYVTVLWRMAGTPAPAGMAPFADITTQSEEFKSAISWAYEKGYVNGTSPDTFEPNASLTREAAMKILFGYAGAQSGMEMMFTGIYDEAFNDSADISAWAKEPMYWGVYKSIISGTGEGQLSPKGTATRAQLAKILIEFTEKN